MFITFFSFSLPWILHLIEVTSNTTNGILIILRTLPQLPIPSSSVGVTDANLLALFFLKRWPHSGLLLPQNSQYFGSVILTRYHLIGFPLDSAPGTLFCSIPSSSPLVIRPWVYFTKTSLLFPITRKEVSL